MSDPFAAPTAVDSFTPRNRWRLRRVGILSLALFSGAAGASLGLLIGLVFASVGAAGVAGAAPGQNVGPLIGFGAGALVVLPLFYGFVGFMGGAVNALLYNLVAGMTGGIEMEFTQS